MTTIPKFSELGLSEAILNSLNKKGFEEPTPIQAKTIPFLLKNHKDLIGKAQTGTGKTAAFGIPLIENLNQNSKSVQAIILAPTRELAIQVSEELNSFAEEKKIRILAVYGGQPIERQISSLKRGVDIIVGTPGRVMDHLERGTMDISKISQIILDEADEMLNMGFVEDIETILKSAPKNRRTVLFSATMPEHIERLAKKYMGEYEIISVISNQKERKNIEQVYYEVSQSDKFEALFRIIDVAENFYGMVFCRTKIDTDEIAHKLINRGLRAEALHGDVSQSQREKILQKFRDKKITVLVATDVAARGIDVDNLTHVVNYSLPQDPESYVHRIGRTGRAGKSGIAVTLITPSEFRKLMSLQRVVNATIAKQKIPNVANVIESKKQRIKTALQEIIAAENYADMEIIADEILSAHTADPKLALAALLKLAFKNELNEKSYKEIAENSFQRREPNQREQNPRKDHSNSRFNRFERSENYGDRKTVSKLFLARGRADGFDPRKVVDLIKNESGVDGRRIDDVKLFDNFSFFSVSSEDAKKILDAFSKNSKGGRSLVSKAKDRR